MNKLILFIALLFLSCNDSKISSDTAVAIQPYNVMESDKTDNIKKAIVEYYGVSVIILPQRKLYKEAFINIKSPRYRADSIIKFQEHSLPDGADYILGLTEIDISTTKHNSDGSVKSPKWRYNDFGIMGLAYCPGKSCIVSGFRLKHKNEELYFNRFKKVVIHELGHNFGLPHCPDKKCVMTDAVESIKTIDNAKPELCVKCKKAIQ
ncbi:zinc-dependent metalloprotease family protein [Flavobacterium sp. DG1-102-2]|uniref:zinc-dependent metalloprotease family protein n=1 Tax=Flavobacterium sp. DG1-102-2 TaxID=3081663 RepID=UPI002949903D|nr:zinc-dependent metalloprotease family protein [Flavobacterium sp. DG1-102-2]MDV6167043.1 zinc-dependent metalloprotease family protein [Flavobacterium sp. DG1-102-2]